MLNVYLGLLIVLSFIGGFVTMYMSLKIAKAISTYRHHKAYIKLLKELQEKQNKINN